VQVTQWVTYGAILFAKRPFIRGLDAMGAKYLPTTNDQKASLRFQQRQNTTSRYMKPTPAEPAKPKTKKKV